MDVEQIIRNEFFAHARRRSLALLTPAQQLALKDWDESKHPRGQSGPKTTAGSFTSAGGGGGEAPDKESAPARSLLQMPTRSVGEMLAARPGAMELDAKARAMNKAGIATDALASEGGFRTIGANGKKGWTPERQAAHDEILNNIFTPEAIAAATPKKGDQPVVHLLGGRGGSGKGWFTGKNGSVDKTSAIVLNNDDVKEKLPGFEGWNAPLFHEESSELGDVAEEMARDKKLNVILDGTMKTPASLDKRVAAYKAAGYKVVGHYMYASPEEAASRAIGRFIEGTGVNNGGTNTKNPDAWGRYVPPEYSLKSTTNEQSFDAVRNQMDSWEVVDNMVPFGEQPKLHARSK